MRTEYELDELPEDKLDSNPILQFNKWFNDAIKHNIIDSNAMVLSTVDNNNKPSSRIVLFKAVDEAGITFHTNYKSRKGIEIRSNPNVSVNIYWKELQRQIRIEGVISVLSHEESDKYFETRPYESKVGAWASKQSAPLKNRAELEKSIHQYSEKYKQEVPRPEHWGGYLIKPEIFEFWQGRKSRLHDRFLFTKEGNTWNTQRLYP